MKYNFGPLLNVDREVPFIEVSLDHYTYNTSQVSFWSTRSMKIAGSAD